MLKTIFFDLDDTLLDFTRGEAESLSKTLLEMGLTPTPAVLERYHVLNARQWALLEEGTITREQVLLGRFQLLFEELGVDLDPGTVCRCYERNLAQSSHMVPGAEELLKLLAGKYALYLVSNGTAVIQHSRLALSGIEPYFRQIFISQEIGFDKPRKEFFESCFETIPGFCREESIIVGDSLTSDIRGGKNAGIRTCWFNPQGKTLRPDILPDYQFSRLDQLPALLETIS